MIASTCSRLWNWNLYATRSSWSSPENFNGQVTPCVYYKCLTNAQANPTYSLQKKKTNKKRYTGTRQAFLLLSSNNHNQINYGCCYIQTTAWWFWEAHRAEQSLKDWHFALFFFFPWRWNEASAVCSIYKSTTVQINLKWNVRVALETRWGGSLLL